MSSTARFFLDLKCLAFGGADGSKAYALVQTSGVHVLVQAQIPAANPHSLTWDFVTAGWSFQNSFYLDGDAASCTMNKAGELIAMGSWSDIQSFATRARRGLVYNPYNPLPQMEGRFTSNALWMEINVGANINNTEREMAQLLIDTGADDHSAMEVALTESHLLIRRVNATGNSRELVGLGGWALPRPLSKESIVQVQYSNKFLYIFTTYVMAADDTSLVRVPFDPNSTFPTQILTGPPVGTTSIDISSSKNKCDWSKGYSTAVADNKFYLLCQEAIGLNYTMHLFVYDNTANTPNPTLGAAVTVTGVDIDSYTKIGLFQPLKNTTFAMLVSNTNSNNPKHHLLSLSGSDVGNATRLTNAWMSVMHDTLYNNILPDQEQIPVPRTDGIPSEEGIVGAVFGALAVLAAIVFLTLRHRRRRRQRSNRNRQNEAESSPDSFGLEPLGASGPSSAVGLTAGAVQSSEANTHLAPTLYAAPQASIPPTAASAAPLSSMTLSPAPSEGSPSVTTSGSPAAATFQMELQQLGFSSHPRPNFVTTVND